jgi:hypothetical protein
MTPHDPLTDLHAIPGMNPDLARKLSELGYQDVDALRDANPERMYDELCMLHDRYLDPGVLQALQGVVRYANHGEARHRYG